MTTDENNVLLTVSYFSSKDRAARHCDVFDISPKGNVVFSTRTLHRVNLSSPFHTSAHRTDEMVLVDDSFLKVNFLMNKPKYVHR